MCSKINGSVKCYVNVTLINGISEQKAKNGAQLRIYSFLFLNQRYGLDQALKWAEIVVKSKIRGGFGIGIDSKLG